MVWRLPLAQGAILETRDRIPHRAPGAWSLLLPLPVSLPLSLVTIIKKNLKKEVKNRANIDSKIAELDIYPEDTEVL